MFTLDSGLPLISSRYDILPLIDSIVCEWNLSTIQQALIPALTYFCCTVGSMLSGQMADYFGRYPVLLANSYMLVVSAVGSALVKKEAPNYDTKFENVDLLKIRGELIEHLGKIYL